MKGRHILVTGSMGLIGAAVTSRLGACGHAMRGIDLAGRGDHRGNILDPAALHAAVKGVDGVIHLAAVSRVIWGERDPAACLRTNVDGTQQVLGALRRVAPKAWLILASSREVYGQSPRLPVHEDAPLQPMNTYARSKLAAEQAVAQAQQLGLRAAILRFSTVYGAVDDHPDRLVPAFCRVAIAGQPLMVEGAENCVDITHVSDVAQAVADTATLLCNGMDLPVMHLTTGRATRLVDLARLVVDLTQSRSAVCIKPARAYDVARFSGDRARAARHIGWAPSTGLTEGIAQLIDALRDTAAR
jgi:UDP-glucose 4-epimerase